MQLMTVKDVATELRYSEEKVRVMARSRIIPMFKMPPSGDWRIARTDFDEWLRARQVSG